VHNLDGSHKENLKNEANRKHEKVKGQGDKSKTSSSSKSQKSSNGTHHSGRDRIKNNHSQLNSIDDELGETDSDDTPSISSSTTDSGTVSESDSGKSSPPSSFPDHPLQANSSNTSTSLSAPEQIGKLQNEQQSKTSIISSSSIIDTNDITSLYTNNSNNNDKVGNNGILKDSGNLADTTGNLTSFRSCLLIIFYKENFRLLNIFFVFFFIARLTKLGLFDDNSSFFSRSTFNSSFAKHNIDGSSDHSQAMSNAQLPDLLNGTLNNNNNNNNGSNNSMGLDPKQLLKNLGNFGSMNNEKHDDWENAFKYLMSKSNFNSNKHYEDQQQEDWLRFQELRKHSNMSRDMAGVNQFNNMFNSELTLKILIFVVVFFVYFAVIS
jgi:hypothetical protein